MAESTWLMLAGLGSVLLSTACGSEATSAAASGGEVQKSTGAAAASYRAGGKKEAMKASVQKPNLAGARAFIDKIYSQYRDRSKEVDIPFTPELDASIEKQSDGPDGPDGLGYDIFCQCQDPGDEGMLKHTIQSLVPTADGATARVSFVILEPPSTKLTIRLARRGSKWMVADVIGADGSLLEKGK